MTEKLHFILLHGFGASPAVFASLETALAPLGTTTLWSLPGYPNSSWPSTTPFAQSSAMAKDLPQNSILIAWSLGGLHALDMQKYSKHIRAIVLLASLPYFLVEKRQRGLTLQGLTQLTERARENTQQGLHYFWKLHSFGGTGLRKQYQCLKTCLDDQATPDLSALLCGLAELQTDMRGAFTILDIPVLSILGDCDLLVHEDEAKKQLNHKESADIFIIKGAGHAFFLTHLENTIKAIELFINKYFKLF